MAIQPYADNFIPVIPTDRLVHTDQQPRCHDPECPCHDKLKQELQQLYQEGLVSAGDASRILEGRQVWQ